MDRNPDIYSDRKKPEADTSAPYSGVDMELTPQQMRMRTWRKTALFTVLMLALLGLASWIIVLHEERRELDEEEEAALVVPPSDAPPDRVGPAIPMPELATQPDPRDYMDDPPPGLDPAKISEAVGEVRLAGQYMRAREFEKATVHAHRALEIWPDMAAALRTLGFSYTQLGRADQAVRALEQAQRLEPFNAENYSMLAAAYMHKGELSKAEEMLQMALDIMPEYPVVHLNLGMLYLAKGQYEAAADYLERSMPHYPQFHSVRNNLAVALLRIGRLREAREHLHTLIGDDPHTPAWYFNMAITYTEERNFDEALVWIRRGADYASPIAFQRFIADRDFDELRQLPQFQELIRNLYPGLPVLPEG